MTSADLIEAYIENKIGSGTGNQFADSYENDDFESQNFNALKLIEKVISKILRNEILKNDEEIKEYHYCLKQYLKEEE